MFNQYPRCRSRVFPPSAFEQLNEKTRKTTVDKLKEAPASSLSLDHIFGSCGSPRSVINIHSSGQQHYLAFAASAAVVVVNVSNKLDPSQASSPKQRHPQRIFTKHHDEVTCLCSRSNLIASSELGFTPKIMVWNATTLELVGPVVKLMERSVSCQSIAFLNSTLIAAMTNDQNHSVSILNWKTGTIVAEARSGPSLSYGVIVPKHVPSDTGNTQLTTMVSFGKRHLRFWVFNRHENTLISSSTSTASDVLCAVAVDRLQCIIAGQGNGTVTFWVQNKKSAGGTPAAVPQWTTQSTLISTLGPVGDASSTAPAVTAIALCRPNSSSVEDAEGKSQQRTNATESTTFTEENTVLFATGQADGMLTVHAMRLQHDNATVSPTGTGVQGTAPSSFSIVVSTLIAIPTADWSASLSIHHRSLTNVVFQWNVWERHANNTSVVRKKPQKIHMGSSGNGCVGRSAFMTKSVMQHQGKKNKQHKNTPAVASSSNSGPQEDEPLLVVGTAGGSIFIIYAKDAPPPATARRNPTTRWSSGIQACYYHHSHGHSCESVEQLDRNHIVSIGRDGLFKIWSIDSERDQRCRAWIGLPGPGVCVAVPGVPTQLATMNSSAIPEHACYVGLADGRVVKVQLHYVSSEEHKKRNTKANANAMRQRQKRGGSSIQSPALVSSATASLGWSLCCASILDVQNANGQTMETIQCMAIRPDNSVLACGSRDNNIYLIDIASHPTAMYIVRMLTGSSSFLLTIDWSMDGKYLQTSDASRELLYWSVPMGFSSDALSRSKQSTSASQLKDVVWSRWTCLFGWSVSGIWAETSDATDVNTTCRGGGKGGEESTLLVTGDDMRNVRLHRWPCLPGSEHVKYQGHHSHVMAVRFCQREVTQDGGGSGGVEWLVVSAGGLDKCVFLWKVVH